MEQSPHRLPRTVLPERYELTLAPDLGTGAFTGEARIRCNVTEPTDRVLVNSVGLTIHGASFLTDDGRELAAEVAADEALERIALSVESPLEAGAWTLHITWDGVLSESLKGFYRSTFTDDSGVEHVIATTQFQSTDARRAFPCWDEPEFKAVFAITLVVDAAMTAVSNGAVVEESDLGEGRRQVTFSETIPMSTYLVAFVVGTLETTETVDVEGVPLRVVCVPGKRHLGGFALESGEHALRYYLEWFGLPYPAQKLDLIAVPDFGAGAMENLGAVIFRESVLLVDTETATKTELQRVADVVSHEIAHMWFGDLVTMRWWNGIWLNEAFATLMEMLAVDHFRPEWERWVSFGRTREAAMVIDSLSMTRTIEYPVDAPDDAEAMFDVLTYEKGAAVLRMLEQYLGDEQFRAGIRHYLQQHTYGSTETADLWNALETITGEPARQTMDSWINQAGYPVVSVTVEGGSVRLAQERFLLAPAENDRTRWAVPVIVRAHHADATPTAHHRLLMSGDTAEIELDSPATVVANAGGHGFYRVSYRGDALASVAARMGDLLSGIERLNLVNDTWASVVAGLAGLDDYLTVAARPPDEDDPDVWWAVTDALGFLAGAVSGDVRDRFLEWARGILGPAFERWGWSPPSDAGERVGARQATLAVALGTWAGDKAVQHEAVRLHASYLDERSAVHTDLVPAVVVVAGRLGGAKEFDQFIQRWKRAANPQEETRYLYALGEFTEAAMVDRALELTLTDARAQNAPFLAIALLSNPAAQDRAWSFIEERWPDVVARFPVNLMPRVLHDHYSPRMFNGVAGFPAALAERASRFLSEHPLRANQRAVDQGLERMWVNVALRERMTEAVALADFGRR